MAQKSNHMEIEVPDDALTEESVITSIADAIATLEDDEPTDIPPLYYTLNTEALNEIFDSTTEDQYLRFDFTFDRYEISVLKDSSVRVTVTSG